MTPSQVASERCREAVTDEVTQVTDSTVFEEDIPLGQSLEKQLSLERLLVHELPASTVLSRLLSAISTISTTPSLADGQQDAAHVTTSDFWSIGEGRLGRVYDWPGIHQAAKICLRNDNIERSR